MAGDWNAHYARASIDAGEAAAVLRDNDHLLPPSGRALDLACGLGANALLLARHGLDTRAWDRAPSAIERLAERAREAGLPLTAEVRDVVVQPPPATSFDVIVVSRFLERSIAPALVEALRPGGLLYYQTFTRARVSDRGPRSERFRLAEGELLELFAPLRVLVHREEGSVGDTSRGLRDEAQLVACRSRG